MTNNQEILGKEPVGKLLMQYSIPAIIGMIVNGLYNVIDRMFIGNIEGVGPLAIAGLGVTMPIMTIMMAFAMLIGAGASANISIKIGEGKFDDAKKLVGNAITLAVITGLSISVIGILFGDQILMMFGASDASLEYAKAYISIIFLGSVFNIIGFVLNPIIRVDGNPKLSATIMVVGCVTNIVLDAVFIFGFDMGIQGAATATIISQLLTAILGLRYFLKGKSNIKVDANSLKLDKRLIKMIAMIGMAPFAMQIAGSMVQVLSNNALKTHGGDLAIGAMATINSVITLAGMPVIGVTQGAQPIIGYNYGSGQYDRATKALKLALMATTGGLLFGWSVVQMFPEQIVSMFNSDKELVALTVDGIRKYLMFMPLIATSMMGANYFQSIGKAKMSMILSLLRQVLLLIPLMSILPRYIGLNGVWYTQAIADVISFVITIVVLTRELKSYKSKEKVEQATV